MNENPEKSTPKPGVVISKPLVITVCVLVLVLLLVIGVMIFMLVRDNADVEDTLPSTAGTTETSALEETTVPDGTEPLVMLPAMAELYAQNPDIAGYIRIDGTKLDYPVMYTPEDEEKYIRKNFDGLYSSAGTPFISADCAISPESDNLVIYGHHMKSGKAFTTVVRYASEEYYKEHPTIYYSTLYEERTYEIVAAFYDRVYYNYEDVFKYYEFIDYETEEEFNEAVEYFKTHSEYDTGVDVEYGDKFITLVTCSYHEQYGRFVVVARIHSEDTPAEAE